jgi:peptidoglycan/LPS O-acetylase OafA/YrhL
MSQSPHPAAIRYEPAIDGLRAIAVLAVLVFHLDPRWLPGGFTGVDIFFVISGYLITRILLGEFDAGTFSIWRFYHRRIARIVPALAFVGFATLLAARFIYDSKHLGVAGASFVASIVSVMNIKLARQGNYFEVSPLTQPFLHCWSLSLEEQFYLVFPFLLRGAWRRSRGAIALLLVTAFAASLCGCIIATPRMPTQAFYLLPFRAWELLAGSLLGAWAWHGVPHPPRPWVKALSAAGMAGIVGSIALMREEAGFPGWIAMAPVAATAALIVAVAIDPTEGSPRWLRGTPLVLVGKLSYALYLTHWPVFSLVDCALFAWSPWVRLVLKLGLTACATWILHVAVETPARSRLLNTHTMRREAALLIFALAVVFPVGLSLRQTHAVLGASMEDVARGGVVLNAAGTRGVVCLVGDSQANQFVTLMHKACTRLGCRLVVLSVSATQPIPNRKRAAPELWERSFRVLEELRPDAVVLSCNWVLWLDGDRGLIDDVVGKIRNVTPALVLVTNTPFLPPAATREAMCAGHRPPFFEEEQAYRSRRLVDRWLLAEEGDGVQVIDVATKVVSATAENRLCDDQGRYLYDDRYHFNEYGARLYEPDFAAALRRALADSGRQPATDR